VAGPDGEFIVAASEPIQIQAKRSFLTEALRQTVDHGASDLHVVVGYPPTMRLNGRLIDLPLPVLEADAVRRELIAACPEHLRVGSDTIRNVDFAFELELEGRPQRVRANYFLSGDSLGACFRVIPNQIPDLQWAGFPVDLADRLTRLRDGLVLFCGMTGAGKTTSLAMIINRLAEQGGCRVLTVEEPVEYLFPRHPGSIITQREVGRDVETFAEGLTYGLRQDPDVILVGEIRDRPTAQMALSAAETGHLVFSTLHTRDAKGAISRYADFFPQDVQDGIRGQLSRTLQAIICQLLLPGAGGGKRELALEILLRTNAIASAIRTGKVESVDRNILTGRAEGMITFDESIRRLHASGRIAAETAEFYAANGGRS
jgi:twitching motility protein PilT